jgi:hypothetical protein
MTRDGRITTHGVLCNAKTYAIENDCRANGSRRRLAQRALRGEQCDDSAVFTSLRQIDQQK